MPIWTRLEAGGSRYRGKSGTTPKPPSKNPAHRSCSRICSARRVSRFSAGLDSPVVAILAEYDALPELSQKPGETQKSPLAKGAPGHGCGHNLLGTAAVAAAVAANRTRLDKRLPGTIQLIGTPAEEMLVGKTFMLQAGAFRSTDVVLSWHPSDDNLIAVGKRLALSASDVEFFGKTAHAAASPWLGRSALDAMELFEHAMSLM